MISGYSYDADGRIFQRFSLPDTDALNAQGFPVNGGINEGVVDPETEYWDGVQLSPRLDAEVTISKTSILADDTDKAIFSDLPVPCVMLVDGVPVDVLDGVLEFTASTIGTYTLVLDEADYLREEWTVDAT